jgi:hypothetical protein
MRKLLVVISRFGNSRMNKVINICIAFSMIIASSSNLLAAALCPHTECWSSNKISQKQRSKSHSNKHSCSTSSSEKEPHNVNHSSDNKGKGDISFDKHSYCAHCFDRTKVPTSIMRNQPLNMKRCDVGMASPFITKQLIRFLLSHTAEVIPSQGSPPDTVRPKHILINLFRI